jgi:hypothetical protein
VVRDQFLARRRAALRQILQRGVKHGEISRREAAVALDLIYGSLWYRLIFDIAPLDNAWAADVTRAIAGGPAS